MPEIEDKMHLVIRRKMLKLFCLIICTSLHCCCHCSAILIFDHVHTTCTDGFGTRRPPDDEELEVLPEEGIDSDDDSEE